MGQSSKGLAEVGVYSPYDANEGSGGFSSRKNIYLDSYFKKSTLIVMWIMGYQGQAEETE